MKFNVKRTLGLALPAIMLVLILTLVPLGLLASFGVNPPKSFVQSGQQPDFQITVEPNQFLALKTVGGGTASVVLTSVWGFTGSVALSASVSPVEASAPKVYLPSSVTLDASPGSHAVFMQVNTTGATSLGLFTITVTGTSGSLTRSATAQVGVTDQFVGANTAYLVYKAQYIGSAYPGGSAVINNTFDSLGDLGVHITKIVLSLDFGSYPESIDMRVGHFEEWATSMSIPIPSSVRVGTYPLTATVSWEYYSQYSRVQGKDLVLSTFLSVYSGPSPSSKAPVNLATFLSRSYGVILATLGFLIVLAVLLVFLVHRRERRKQASMSRGFARKSSAEPRNTSSGIRDSKDCRMVLTVQPIEPH